MALDFVALFCLHLEPLVFFFFEKALYSLKVDSEKLSVKRDCVTVSLPPHRQGKAALAASCLSPVAAVLSGDSRWNVCAIPIGTGIPQAPANRNKNCLLDAS